MKKTIIIFLALLLNVSILISAQESNTTDIQKPSKEDFYYTWVSKSGTGFSKFDFEVTFKESSYLLVNITATLKFKQNYVISRWEEAVNTFVDTDEYPYGFKIFSRENGTGPQNDFYIFINADKTKYLSVFSSVLGDDIQSRIYIKNKKQKNK